MIVFATILENIGSIITNSQVVGVTAFAIIVGNFLHDYQHGSSQVDGVIVFATIVGNIGSMITNMGAAR